MPKKKSKPAGTHGVAPGRRRISYVDDQAVHAQLKELGERHGLDTSDVIRHATRMYLKAIKEGDSPLPMQEFK